MSKTLALFYELCIQYHVSPNIRLKNIVAIFLNRADLMISCCHGPAKYIFKNLEMIGKPRLTLVLPLKICFIFIVKNDIEHFLTLQHCFDSVFLHKSLDLDGWPMYLATIAT